MPADGHCKTTSDTTLDKALHATVEEWDSWVIACEYRSSVQFMLDDLDGKVLLDSDEVELLNEADENLRTLPLLLVPPRPPLPNRIPETHWWWFLPDTRSRD